MKVKIKAMIAAALLAVIPSNASAFGTVYMCETEYNFWNKNVREARKDLVDRLVNSFDPSELPEIIVEKCVNEYRVLPVKNRNLLKIQKSQ